MKHVWLRAAAISVAALLLIAAYKRAEPSSVMADAANALLNSLWPDQKAKVSYAFEDDERLSWHFVPTGANYKPGDRELVHVDDNSMRQHDMHSRFDRSPQVSRSILIRFRRIYILLKTPLCFHEIDWKQNFL